MKKYLIVGGVLAVIVNVAINAVVGHALYRGRLAYRP